MESEHICKLLLDFAADWEFWLDPEGACRYVSPACERITGYRPDEFMGEAGLLRRIVHPEDREAVESHLTDALANREGVCPIDFRIITRTGEVRWISHHCQPVHDGAGTFLGRRGSNRDITDRMAAQEENRRLGGLMERLVRVVQELSRARSLDEITAVVRTAARELVSADGATFVLRENGNCFYADEDAIAPLWKGLRFPLERCISGWVMLNRQAAVIEDIYQDQRIPVEAYRPTFVQSLAMVPIRGEDPIGAIGTYWARRHRPSEQEISVIQALADTTSVAMENVRVYADLEQRVRERTEALETANRELEAFGFSVSHDLRGPLRRLDGYSRILYEDYADRLEGEGRDILIRMIRLATRMEQLIDDLLRFSRSVKGEVVHEAVNLSRLARSIARELSDGEPGRAVDFIIADGLTVEGDPGLLRAAMENILRNAWKYTAPKENAVIEFGRCEGEGERLYFIRDNGVGFDMAHKDKLFQPFERLHDARAFEGTGIGLATVKRIIDRHGGRIWAEGTPGAGATFYFTLPEPGGES